jgi:hypothetical protein
MKCLYLSKSANIFINEVEATIAGNERSDLFTVFHKLNTATFPKGRVGLLRFDTTDEGQ